MTDFRIENPNAGGATIGFPVIGASANQVLYADSSSNLAGSNSFVYNGSGKVSINTSNFVHALDVYGITGATIVGVGDIPNAGNPSTYFYADATAGIGGFETRSNHPLVLGTNDTNALTIDTSQRIAIGASSTNFKLGVLDTTATNKAMLIRRGTQGSDSSMVITYGTPYLAIGGSEFRTNSIQTIGFGYTASIQSAAQPAEIGFLTTDVTANTKGDLVFATRSVTTNTAPTERMRITSGGLVGINGTPTHTFDVYASAPSMSIGQTGTFSGIAPYISFVGSNAGNQISIGYRDGTGNFVLGSGSDITSGELLYVIRATGFLGLGISPTQLFQIEGANSNIKIRGNTSSGTWGYLAQSATALYLNNNAFATASNTFVADAVAGASSIQLDRGFIAFRTVATPATPPTSISNWIEGMRIDSSGNSGFLTSAPTHTITLGSTGTGISINNVADQVTNYERLVIAPSSNIFKISVEKGGTGTARDFQIVSALGQLIIKGATATGPVIDYDVNSSSATTWNAFRFGNGTMSTGAASGIFTNAVMQPTIASDSGTHGYTVLRINPQESSVTGSGLRYLLHLQNTNVDEWTVNSVGKQTVYAAIATAGWGVPAIYGAPRLTGQTAAASLTAVTVGAADGSFEISANVNVTTSTLHNFTVTCTYTDEGNTSRTLTLGFTQLSGATLITAITNVTGAGPYESPVYHIRCKASTTITIASVGGGGFTTVTYNIEGIIKQTA